MSQIEQQWLLLTPENTKETRDGLYPFAWANDFHPTIEDLRQWPTPVSVTGEALLRHDPNIGNVISDLHGMGSMAATMLYYHVKPDDASMHHTKDTLRSSIRRIAGGREDDHPFKHHILDPNLNDLTIVTRLRGRQFYPMGDEIVRRKWERDLPKTIKRVQHSICGIEKLPTNHDILAVAAEPMILVMAALLRENGEWNNDLFEELKCNLNLGPLGLIQVRRTIISEESRHASNYKLTGYHPGPYAGENLKPIPV